VQTRQRWQLDSWLKLKSTVYLGDEYGVPGYLKVATKYVDWFNEEYRLSDYDWLFFCDDDTFVFTDKLEEHLNCYSHNEPFCIGNKLGEFVIEGTDKKTTCASGGAGIAISQNLALQIQQYIKQGNSIITNESDTSLAVWCKMACDDFVFIDKSNLFSPVNPRHPHHVGKGRFITYHYCEQKDFIKLGEEL
jgi:hypothetical protein